MSFYTGSILGSGMYSSTYSSKYGGAALRQKNSTYTTLNQNNIAAETQTRTPKYKKPNNEKYALATISLMAISAVAGYNMKGGLKNIGSSITNAGSAVENAISKGAGNAKTGIKNLAGKIATHFKTS